MKHKWLIPTLIVFLLLFIWGNSMLPPAKSNSLSNNVVQAVGGTITHSESEVAKASTLFNSANIRKLAHFIEYAALGVFIMLLRYRLKKPLSAALLAGMSIALIDETVQLFSGRTSMVQDVWLDMAGFVMGMLIVFLIKKLQNRRG